MSVFVCVCGNGTQSVQKTVTKKLAHTKETKVAAVIQRRIF